MSNEYPSVAALAHEIVRLDRDDRAFDNRTMGWRRGNVTLSPLHRRAVVEEASIPLGQRLCALFAMADLAPERRMTHPFAPGLGTGPLLENGEEANVEPEWWQPNNPNALELDRGVGGLTPRCVYVPGAKGLEGG